MLDLHGIGPGFADPVLEAQTVFRQALKAFSRPGMVVGCAAGHVGDAGVALALALLDPDTALWLSPSFAKRADQIRFHTGSILVDDPGMADFLLVGNVRELPPLEGLRAGSDEAPQRSATIILRVAHLAEGRGWTLRGPGICGTRELKVSGLDANFVEMLHRNARRFPCGVDLFLYAGDHLCGLPRTTRLET